MDSKGQKRKRSDNPFDGAQVPYYDDQQVPTNMMQQM
jgi:hypothetical protein